MLTVGRYSLLFIPSRPEGCLIPAATPTLNNEPPATLLPRLAWACDTGDNIDFEGTCTVPHQLKENNNTGCIPSTPLRSPFPHTDSNVLSRRPQPPSIVTRTPPQQRSRVQLAETSPTATAKVPAPAAEQLLPGHPRLLHHHGSTLRSSTAGQGACLRPGDPRHGQLHPQLQDRLGACH